MPHYLGAITLNLFVTRLLDDVVLAFYVASLGFFPDLFFFSISNRTFFLYSTTVIMCGLFAPNRIFIGWKRF